VAGGAPGGGRVSCGRARVGRRARGGRRAERWMADDGRAARCEDGRASELAQLRRARRTAQHRGGQWRPSSGGRVSCGRARGGRRSRTRGEFV